MPIEPNERPIPDLVLIPDTAENKIALPQDGAYRWIHGRIVFNLTNGTPAPSYKAGNIVNYIKNIAIQKNGRGYKYQLPLEIIHLLSIRKKGKAPYKKQPSTIANAANYEAIVDFEIDFATFPLSDRDTTALLQTKNLSSLHLIVQTGNKNDIAFPNPPTINSCKIELEIREYTGIDDKTKLDINDDTQVKMTDFIEQHETIDLEAGRNEFDGKSQAVDLVASAAILEHMLLVKDNGVLSDSKVTDVKFARARTDSNFPKKDFLERSWKHLNEKNVTGYDLDERTTGVVFINWIEKLGQLGLVTRAKSYEFLRLKTFAVNEAQDTLELYTRYV